METGQPVLEESGVTMAEIHTYSGESVCHTYSKETINNIFTSVLPNPAMRKEFGNATEVNLNVQMQNNSTEIIFPTRAQIKPTFPPKQEFPPTNTDVQGLAKSDSGHLVTSHTTAASCQGEDQLDAVINASHMNGKILPELDASELEYIINEIENNPNQPMMESSNHVMMETGGPMKEVETTYSAVTFEKWETNSVCQTPAPVQPTFAASRAVQEFLPMKVNGHIQMTSQTTPVTQIFTPSQEPLPMKNEALELVASNSRDLTISHTTAAMVEASSKAKVENLKHGAMQVDGPIKENATGAFAVQVKTTNFKLIWVAAVRAGEFEC